MQKNNNNKKKNTAIPVVKTPWLTKIPQFMRREINKICSPLHRQAIKMDFHREGSGIRVFKFSWIYSAAVWEPQS